MRSERLVPGPRLQGKRERETGPVTGYHLMEGPLQGTISRRAHYRVPSQGGPVTGTISWRA